MGLSPIHLRDLISVSNVDPVLFSELQAIIRNNIFASL